MLAWVSSTHFGAPVVPDVEISTAASSGDTARQLASKSNPGGVGSRDAACHLRSVPAGSPGSGPSGPSSSSMTTTWSSEGVSAAFSRSGRARSVTRTRTLECPIGSAR